MDPLYGHDALPILCPYNGGLLTTPWETLPIATIAIEVATVDAAGELDTTAALSFM